MTGLRISSGLPRGGLGFSGVLVAIASLVVSFQVPLTTAVPLSVACLLLALWCAAGLRRDDEAGEVSDRIDWRKRPHLIELVTGDRTDTVQRVSTITVVLCGVALVIEACRFFLQH